MRATDYMGVLATVGLMAQASAAAAQTQDESNENELAIADLIEQLPVDRLVVLGDSASDAGNLQTLLAPFADPTPSALGYVDGRFSNGPTFADNISLRLLGVPTSASLQGGDNYAFGGATIVTDIAVGNPLAPIPPIVPDFTQQVDAYVANGIDSNALHILQFGNNDSIATAVGPAPLQPSLAAISQTYSEQLGRLIAVGANQFAIATTFAAPNFPTAAPVTEAFLSAAASLDRPGDGLQFYVLDIASVVTTIQDNPQAFGVDPALLGTPCFFVPGGPPDCDGFLTVDGIHETAALFERIADKMVIAVIDQYRAPRTMVAITEEAALRSSARVDRLSTLAPRDLEIGQWGFVGDASWNVVERDHADLGSDWEADGVDITGGIFGQVSSTLIVGGGLFHSQREFESGPDFLEVEADTSEFGGFAQVVFDNDQLDIGATATFSSLDLDDYRRPIGDGRIARADSDGDAHSIALEAGYDFIEGRVDLRPFTAVSHVSVDFDDIVEMGAREITDLNNRHMHAETELTIATGGIDFALPIGKSDNAARMTARVAYDHAVDDFDQSITSELVAFPGLTREAGPNPIDGWGRMEVAIERHSEPVLLGIQAAYRTDFHDFDALSLSALARTRF